MTKVTIPITMFDTDTQVQQLATGAVIKGAKPYNDGGNVVYNITSQYLILDYVKLLASKGAQIENHPLFIEIGSPDDLVPEGMIGRLDPDDNVLAWKDWILENHSVYESDSRYFIGTDSHMGRYLTIAELMPVIDLLVDPSDVPVDEDELE